MKVVFADRAWEDYLHWQASDPKQVTEINSLIKEAQRDPFRGTGMPEPLRGDRRGWWSRRITQAGRLVYRVSGPAGEQVLEIAQCRFHY